MFAPESCRIVFAFAQDVLRMVWNCLAFSFSGLFVRFILCVGHAYAFLSGFDAGVAQDSRVISNVVLRTVVGFP